MPDDPISGYYEIWFEHGVFITPGPRFARLDEAVDHARKMVQSRPETSVSIRFPSTPVDTFVRAKQPETHHEPFGADEDTSVDNLRPVFDGGETWPYDTYEKHRPAPRNSAFHSRTAVMSSADIKAEIKKGLKKSG